jgi:hypothetical protein
MRTGIKIQGDISDEGTNLVPQNVYLGYVESNNQVGTGLYIQDAVNTTVNSYVGNNNGTDGTYPDVWVSGQNTTINNVSSTNAGTVGLDVRPDVNIYALGSVSILNAGQLQSGLTVGMDVEGVTHHQFFTGQFKSVAVLHTNRP